MSAVEIIYPGTPVPQARARHGKGFTFTPAKTRAATANLKAWLIEQWGNRPLFDGAVTLEVVFVMPIPKGWRGWRMEAYKAGHPAFKHHTSKPDADNLVKLVKDSAKGVLWVDDSQVAELHVSKIYGERAETRITVSGIAARPETKAAMNAPAQPAPTRTPSLFEPEPPAAEPPPF